MTVADCDAPILTVSGLGKSFGGLAAVNGVDLSIRRGSITALIGPNGAGKTTLFDLITGFARPDRGTVRFAGTPIESLPAHRIAKLGLVRTFQLTRVFSAMTVLDNMMLAARDQPGEALSTVILVRRSKQHERGVRERARELLRHFKLDAKADDYAASLSGGQRKLLEFARALMTEPKLLLLDEPMAGVNKVLGRELLDHVEALRASADITFLFVEHDMDVVMTRADHVIVMAEGRVISEGTPEAVRSDQRVIDAYLGQPRGAA
jgi:branched-chain amino acid transport system ATP-binding protein